MSMQHKAFLFDIGSFESELAPVLMNALLHHDPAALVAFIEAHRDVVVDPYEGEPLENDWLVSLQRQRANDATTLGDEACRLMLIQDVADHALTKYYNVKDDEGLGNWLNLSERLSEPQRAALLGIPFGPAANPFDPGRMGSYFQDWLTVQQSQSALRDCLLPELRSFLALLAKATAEHKGVYVTF